jgi:hypothetical protein
MPEGANVEVAHRLTENEHRDDEPRRWHRLVEFAEVAILAIVAVATAWSGFQATQWDGRQSLLYGDANRDRFEADGASTYAGQELSADASIFTAWLQARSVGNTALQAELESRFTPDYRDAFDAWTALESTDPASAPPGPAAMPQYHNPHQARAETLNATAQATFDHGTEARETADKYVRGTVLFATVLFLIALGQRFKRHTARLGVNVLGGLLLIYTIASVAGLPRL